jgi:putative addiction module killer protein
MNIFESTEEFDAWLVNLKSSIAKARVLHRIDAAKLGNFGDCKSVGEGVSELRIDFGPGYRVYFTKIGHIVYMLLAGGDKSSQKADIKRALALSRALKSGEST